MDFAPGAGAIEVPDKAKIFSVYQAFIGRAKAKDRVKRQAVTRQPAAGVKRGGVSVARGLWQGTGGFLRLSTGAGTDACAVVVDGQRVEAVIGATGGPMGAADVRCVRERIAADGVAAVAGKGC
jgi:hypothetical protein